jgi:hypothetical protein
MMYRAPMVLSLAGKAEAVLVDIVNNPIALQDRDRWAESIAAICAGTVLVGNLRPIKVGQQDDNYLEGAPILTSPCRLSHNDHRETCRGY